MSEYELSPCPFCNREPRINSGTTQDMNARIPYHFVVCTNCNARGPSYSEYNYDSLDAIHNAKLAWNHRTIMELNK